MAEADFKNPFRISANELGLSPRTERVAKLALPVISKALGLTLLANKYDRLAKQNHTNPSSFIEAVLSDLEIKYSVQTSSKELVPAEGPVVVVSNHPFGCIEGLILGEILRENRPDIKIMANSLLGRISEIKDLFLLVNPFGGEKATRDNVQGIKETYSWLNEGNVLGVFPSGTVSHYQKDKRTVCDPEWSTSVAKMIRKTGATVVPVYFHGRNSLFFQIAGLIHPLLRTVLLPRQLLNKKGKQVHVTFGSPISADKFKKFETDKDILSFIRMRAMILRNRREEGRKKLIFPLGTSTESENTPEENFEKIVEPVPSELMANEIAELPEEQKLVSQKEYTVYHAKASQIPFTLREIGRLREITFRQAKEGTGKSIDLDNFDKYYTHLFIWNHQNQDIVGAYRIGEADKIIRKYGCEGLYSAELFEISEKLFEQLGPALELGRSFVRKEYQRNFWSLLLLWKGIGAFVVRNPQYRNLFGPVSISNEYDSLSRHILAVFLKMNCFEENLSKYIRGNEQIDEPHSARSLDFKGNTVVNDLKEVSALISEIEEQTEKGVPILLQQYLKLGGKILGFNLDKDFGNVLDGLIVVDMLELNKQMLNRYLGKEGSEEFKKYHANLKSAEIPRSA